MPGPSGTTPVLELPYPTPQDTVDVPRDIKALAEKLDPVGTVPVGAVMMWMAAVAPDGWLILTGQSVSASTYPGLASLFGQTGGNVTLPDMTARFPAGAGTGDMALAQNGGANAVKLTAAQSGIQSHAHGGTTAGVNGGPTALSHQHYLNNPGEPAIARNIAIGNGQYMGLVDTVGGVGWWSNDGGLTAPGWPSDHGHAIPAESAPANSDHENRPLFLAVNFIIRAG